MEHSESAVVVPGPELPRRVLKRSKNSFETGDWVFVFNGAGITAG